MSVCGVVGGRVRVERPHSVGGTRSHLPRHRSPPGSAFWCAPWPLRVRLPPDESLPLERGALLGVWDPTVLLVRFWGGGVG